MPSDVQITDVIIKQVAALSATGASILEISEQLHISRYHAKKITLQPEFKKIIRDIGDDAVATAKQLLRTKTGELANEVYRVIRERLEDNDLEAAKVVLKIIGFDQQEQTQGDTQINVVLPGQAEVKTVDSEFRVLEPSEAKSDNG